jgi:BolA protein
MPELNRRRDKNMSAILGMVGKRLQDKLEAAFAPSLLEVIDQSESHRGHAGYREGGETHFHVRITADAFTGQTRVAQHRMINKAVADELQTHGGRVHALSLEVQAGD